MEQKFKVGDNVIYKNNMVYEISDIDAHRVVTKDSVTYVNTYSLVTDQEVISTVYEDEIKPIN